MTGFFHSTPRCREPGCLAMSRRSGFCGRCAARQTRTSDGKTGGNTPKLTPEQVAEARRRYACLETKTSIARRFGVHLKTLNRYLEKS